MTPAIDREWLEALTEPTSPYDYKKHPWTIEFEEGKWTLVTNGQFLIMLRAEMGYPQAEGEWVAGFLSVGSKPVASDPVTISLPELRAFCGFPEAPTAPQRCATCKGGGTVTCPACKGEEEDCTCEHCGNLHVSSCRRCDDSGEIECPTCSGDAARLRPALFGQSWFDRSLLGRAVAVLPGESVTWRHISGTPTRAVIEGPEWRVWVMPLRGPEGSPLRSEYDGGPTFPPLAPVPA